MVFTETSNDSLESQKLTEHSLSLVLNISFLVLKFTPEHLLGFFSSSYPKHYFACTKPPKDFIKE